MPGDDERVPGARRPGGDHELLLLEGENAPSHGPGVGGPIGEAEDKDEVEDGGPEHGDDRDREEHEGVGHEDVGGPHDEVIDLAAVEAGNQAEDDPHERGEEHSAEPYEEGNPAPVEDASEHVSPEVVGAERMGKGSTGVKTRRGKAGCQVLVKGAQRVEEGKGKAGKHDEDEHDPADKGALPAGDLP